MQSLLGGGVFLSAQNNYVLQLVVELKSWRSKKNEDEKPITQRRIRQKSKGEKEALPEFQSGCGD